MSAASTGAATKQLRLCASGVQACADLVHCGYDLGRHFIDICVFQVQCGQTRWVEWLFIKCRAAAETIVFGHDIGHMNDMGKIIVFHHIRCMVVSHGIDVAGGQFPFLTQFKCNFGMVESDYGAFRIQERRRRVLEILLDLTFFCET